MQEPEVAHLTADEIAGLTDRDGLRGMPPERAIHARSCAVCKQAVAMHREEDSQTLAKARPASRRTPIHFWIFVAPAAAVMVATGAGWWSWDHWIARDPARLLRSAYTQQRPFEFRIPGAGHGPVRLERGNVDSPFQRPPAFLEAEGQIARGLREDPQSVRWLALRAEAEMLAWDSETAIATLQHALERKPDDPDLLADLGMAYALRAEAANRDVDYGYAIEYLGRSLKAKPNSPEAVFNRAVVFERMYLYEEAVLEWRRYLEMDKTGAWREEGQRRLADLEQKKKVRLAALAQISDNPEVLLRRIAAGEDVEPESYLDVAVVEWLPRRWDNPKYEQALDTLAARFEARHHDPWLRDVLAARRSNQLVSGLAALSQAVKANLAEESDRALANALESGRDLRAAGDHAGALRGDLEQVYALHRALETATQCVQVAAAVEHKARALNYLWILGQATLEEGNCRSLLGDFGAADRDITRALEQVTQAGYRDLQLRAAGILPNLQTASGNLLAAWDVGREGLATYWKGPYSPIRAHQNYFNLLHSAESLGQPQTAYVFARAAAMALAETPRQRAEANARARVARLASAVGWPEEAKREYERGARLFDLLAQTKTNSQYRALAELNRAEAELTTGAPEAAMKHLQAVRLQVENIGAALARIRFHMDVADALRQSGRRQDSEAAYRLAIELSERHLSTFRGAPERAGLMRTTGRAYRGLVDLYWDRGDIAEAARIWEWFRGGEIPGPRAGPDLDVRLPQLSRESFLSYAILGDNIVAWVFDDRGIEGRRLAVTKAELDTTASRFLRECANPLSNPQTIHRDARQLYDWLVAPLAHRLDAARTLVLEPDGAIGAIPMQVLMDENSRYLGERFAITVSSGLADYQMRANAGPVTVGKALVVADPALGKEMSRTFPPLPQTLREGSSVAARFPHSVLVTQGEATLAAVEHQRPEAELFHFAGHGFSNASNGGLLLAPEGSGSDEAGVLDGKLLKRQDWSRCRLAVLSACSTGTGEVRGPVNPESLVRNLLWAGVARVVATRWNVDADTSVLLMDHFYNALLSGSDVASSLRQAARHLRENRATSHPYYWAGFQSFGSR